MIVAGGGTGGHLFPGLAVAECLSEASDAALFIGSAYGIEARVIPTTRFTFHALAIRGLRGRGWLGAAQLLVQLPAAVVGAWRALGAFGAELVLGVGGYASFPAVLAAWMRRIPVVLLEPNARPGLTNRALGRMARRVCTSFDAAAAHFPAARVVRTGNPVRALARAPRRAAAGFHLLVFGGSQGAHRLNQAFCDAAAQLRASIPDLHVRHQAGEADVELVRRGYAAADVTAQVSAFIDDMAGAYADADLVVCRSGATTMAELTALGKAAILVPYPHAADDHQHANAAVLAEQGAALLLRDSDLSGARLAATVTALAQDSARRESMAQAAARLGVPDAAMRVVQVCRAVLRTRD